MPDQGSLEGDGLLLGSTSSSGTELSSGRPSRSPGNTSAPVAGQPLVLDPRARIFRPGARVHRLRSIECGESAKVVNITDELLSNLPRLDPVMEWADPMEILGVTAELMREQDTRKAERLRTCGRSDSSVDSDPPAYYPDAGPRAATPDRSQASTPLALTPGPSSRGRPRFRDSPIRSRGPRLTLRDVSFLLGRRNRRRRRNLNKKVINYSDEGEVFIAEEKNKKKTGLRWKARPPRKLKFVDNGMILAKVNMDSADVCPCPGGRTVKSKLDLQSQNMFRRVVAKAESRGMVVNKQKTKILCVSDAQTYKAECRLLDSDGNALRSGEAMKVLGFHIDSRPSAHAHVKALQNRIRETAWVLRHLKIAGFSEDELATVYQTVVRPVLDYCAVVYHPMLTDEQDQSVERLQARALKNIYGYKDSYATMREKAGVTTHRARRIELCDTFAQSTAANPRFEWFPLREGR